MRLLKAAAINLSNLNPRSHTHVGVSSILGNPDIGIFCDYLRESYPKVMS